VPSGARRNRARAFPSSAVFQVGSTTTPATTLLTANMGASPDAGLWRVIALVPCTSETAAQPVLARLRSAASQRDADPQAIVSLAVNLAHELAAKTVHVDRDAAHWSEEEERASLANGDERVQGHFETLLILG